MAHVAVSDRRQTACNAPCVSFCIFPSRRSAKRSAASTPSSPRRAASWRARRRRRSLAPEPEGRGAPGEAVKKVLQIALGIVAAFGGFVDIGGLVFNVQAGALFGHQLLWAVPIGVAGIVTYAEMCGRVATITNRPVFDVIRQRMGFGPGLVILLAAQAINILTVAAEVGGIALILQLFFADLPFRVLLLIAGIVLTLAIFVLPFQAIERVFGYGGLFLVVFIVAVVFKLHPNWSDIAGGFVPHWQTGQDTVAYWYFFVGVIAAALISLRGLLLFLGSDRGRLGGERSCRQQGQRLPRLGPRRRLLRRSYRRRRRAIPAAQHRARLHRNHRAWGECAAWQGRSASRLLGDALCRRRRSGREQLRRRLQPCPVPRLGVGQVPRRPPGPTVHGAGSGCSP
jgi:Natural resistance-associated macrophage protein